MEAPAAGLILAGGQSRRMGGREKAFFEIGGESLVARAAARLSPQVAAAAISANGDPRRFALLALPVLPDPVPGFAGPLAGLFAGLAWARQAGHARLATVAVDTPFFPLDLVARLARAVAKGAAPAVAASQGRVHPVSGLWPVALAADLEAVLSGGGSLSIGAFARRHGAVEVPFDAIATGGVAVDPFLNVNTPEDLAAARDLAAGEATWPPS